MSKRVWIIVIAYAAFVSLGWFDGLLGVVWPSVRTNFNLPVDALGIFLLAATSGHIVASFGNGRLIRRWGVAKLLNVSSISMAAALVVMAVAPTWGWFVTVGFVLGIGGGLMDAAMNTYAAEKFRPRLMNWLHACFSMGTTGGALWMTTVLARNWDWRLGLGLVAGLHVVVLGGLLLTRRSWRLDSDSHREAAADVQNASPLPPTAATRDTARLPIVWVSVLIFVLYTGLEMGLGSWAFTVLTEGHGIPETTAGFWVTLYWGSLTAGRIILGFIETNVVRLVRLAMIGTLIGCGLFALFLSPLWGAVGLMMAGFSLAPIFPAMISLTPRRVGRAHAPNVIGFEIAAAGLGGAILPGLEGVIGDAFGLPMIAVVITVVAVMQLALHEGLVAMRPENAWEPA